MGPVLVALNRNKRFLALDLKTEPGRRALRRWSRPPTSSSTICAPEAVAGLGFGYEAVKALKPDIVYVEAMGYAAEGPYAGRRALDDLIQVASGATGPRPDRVHPDEPLKFVPSIIADKTCGLFAAIACRRPPCATRRRPARASTSAVPTLETFTGFVMAEHLLRRDRRSPPTGKFGYTTTLSPFSLKAPAHPGRLDHGHARR